MAMSGRSAVSRSIRHATARRRGNRKTSRPPTRNAALSQPRPNGSTAALESCGNCSASSFAASDASTSMSAVQSGGVITLRSLGDRFGFPQGSELAPARSRSLSRSKRLQTVHPYGVLRLDELRGYDRFMRAQTASPLEDRNARPQDPMYALEDHLAACRLEADIVLFGVLHVRATDADSTAVTVLGPVSVALDPSDPDGRCALAAIRVS